MPASGSEGKREDKTASRGAGGPIRAWNAGTVAGMGREAGETMRDRAKDLFGGMDFVSREEFDAVKDLAASAREEVEAFTETYYYSLS